MIAAVQRGASKVKELALCKDLSYKLVEKEIKRTAVLAFGRCGYVLRACHGTRVVNDRTGQNLIGLLD